jgi:hypothetical protein
MYSAKQRAEEPELTVLPAALRLLVGDYLGLDGGRGHIRRPRDLLLAEAVLDRGPAVYTHDDRHDAERDEDHRSDEASDLK